MKPVVLFLFLLGFSFSISLPAQDWKAYPYQPAGAVLEFPLDEGRHPGTPIEWWYVNARVTGEESGDEYSFMLTYFHYPAFGFDGFRIFNISNETTGVFHAQTLPCNYPVLSDTSLHVEADPLGIGLNPEHWVTRVDQNGELLPFEYEVFAQGGQGAINLTFDTQKRPLILGGTGFLYQGLDDFTYYYSQTGVTVSGTLTFEGFTEPVTGTAWIDRQYGDFNPNVDEQYEWFSLQLSNGMDINMWNIFTGDNRIPDTSTYRILSAYVNEDSALTISDFELERLGYVWMPDGEVNYARRWRLTAEAPDLDLIITTLHDDHEVSLPFRFFEGTTTIEGTVEGMPVTGHGFAELLHSYEDPEVAIVFPGEGEPWDLAEPMTWELLNPDDGRPVYYDLEVSYDDQESYVPIAQGLTETSFLWDAAGFPADSLYYLRLTAYSVDTTLVSVVETEAPVSLVSGTREEELAKAVRVYPNPARGQVWVEWAQGIGGAGEWRLRDAAGRLLRQGKIEAAFNTFSLNLSGFAPGRYLLELRTKEGQWIFKPLIFH